MKTKSDPNYICNNGKYQVHKHNTHNDNAGPEEENIAFQVLNPSHDLQVFVGLVRQVYIETIPLVSKYR